MAVSKRILLITSFLGYGHRRAAEAIENALRKLYPNVESKIIDFWRFLSAPVSHDIQNFYRRLIFENPELYDKLYHLDIEGWREVLSGQRLRTEIAPLLEAIRQLFDLPLNKAISLTQEVRERLFIRLFIERLIKTPRLEDWWLSDSTKWLIKKILHHRVKDVIKTLNPHVIVTTQVWPSFLLSFLKSYGRPSFKVPLVSVITDFGVNNFWTLARATDLFSVGTNEMADIIQSRGFDSNRVRVTGIPVGIEFLTPPSKRDALLSLSLDPALPTLLAMGGGLGIGLDNLTEMIKDSRMKYNVIIITGENTELYNGIRSLRLSPFINIRLFGKVEDMVTLMTASDLVLSKPGGLTVAEALALGRPVLVPFNTGGQERFNIEYLERYGLGIVLKDKRSYIEVLQKYFSDLIALKEWQEHTKGFGRPEASLVIAREVINII